MTGRSHRPTVAVDVRALVGQPTGIGFFTLEMLLDLERLGRFRYAAMAHEQTSRDDELRRAGIAVERQRAPFGVWWQQITLARRVARDDIDLLWSPLNTLPLRPPKPAVVTVHDLTAVLHPEAHRLKVRLSILPFIRPTLETASRVVADSLATADDLRFHFPQCAARLSVIYPGVRPDFHPAPAEEIAATRERLESPDGYVLFVGTLEPRKNVPVLLDAWEALRRDDPSTPPLVLSGDPGWHSRGLLRRFEALAPLGLKYLGHTSRADLIRLFQAATVFVYPSFYEGFGLPPLEAMACGVPTITSNRSSLLEVAGQAALTIDPDDPEGLARALRRILSEPGLAGELGERGVEHAASFSWARAAAEMETLFERSLETPWS